MKTKAYNISALQITTAEKSVTASGTDQIKFRGTLTVGGREIERTIVAQGAAAALLAGKLRKGRTIDLRVMFSRAPANDNTDSKGRGGEYLTVVALPRAKAA